VTTADHETHGSNDAEAVEKSKVEKAAAQAKVAAEKEAAEATGTTSTHEESNQASPQESPKEAATHSAQAAQAQSDNDKSEKIEEIWPNDLPGPNGENRTEEWESRWYNDSSSPPKPADKANDETGVVRPKQLGSMRSEKEEARWGQDAPGPPAPPADEAIDKTDESEPSAADDTAKQHGEKASNSNAEKKKTGADKKTDITLRQRQNSTGAEVASYDTETEDSAAQSRSFLGLSFLSFLWLVCLSDH